MQKVNPIWQELPPNFKRDVIGRLDFKSRCSLQLCSIQDNKLVLSSPIYLKSVSLYPPETIRIDDVPYKSPQNVLIGIFIRIFRHPKSFAKCVDFICGGYGKEEIMASFLEAFFGSLESEPKFKIHSEKMYYDGPRKVLLDESFSKLLKLFDPRNLRCISIAPRICPSIMEEVVNSEQWKNATSLQSFGIYEYDTDLEPFFHFNQLNIQHFEHLRAEKAWKFVQNFLSRNPPLESSFKVLSIADLNMDLLFKFFPVPPFNQPTEDNDSNYFKHTQLFELPNRKNQLVVKITRAGIFGAVCRKTHLEVDFRWAVFRVRIQ